MRYAQMEFEAGNAQHMRQIFERGILVDYTYVPLWHRYAQLEARLSDVERATAVLERATALLPYESKLWLQYLEYEEIRGNTEKCRSIFENWSKVGSSDVWRPWYTFELRTNKDRTAASEIARQWVQACPSDADAWIACGSESDPGKSLEIYKSAIKSGQLDRTALSRVQAKLDLLEGRCETVRTNPPVNVDHGNSIDLWWASAVLANTKRAKLHILSRAVAACQPPRAHHKTLAWRKFALLWLWYAAIAETTDDESPSQVPQIYEEALKHWDHQQITSATLWQKYSDYFVRKLDLALARKVMGSALMKTSKNPRGHRKILRAYIDLETRLANPDRARKLFCILCKNWPQDSLAWCEFASLEITAQEPARAESIYRAALVSRDLLDDVDLVWKHWAETMSDIDLAKARLVWEEATRGAVDRADMYANFAMFEVGTGLSEESDDVDDDALSRARSVFKQGMETLEDRRDARLQLLDLYEQFEETYGTEDTYRELQRRYANLQNEEENEEEENLEQMQIEGFDEILDENEVAHAEITSLSSDDSIEEDSITETPSQPSVNSALQRLLANAHKWKQTQSS